MITDPAIANPTLVPDYAAEFYPAPYLQVAREAIGVEAKAELHPGLKDAQGGQRKALLGLKPAAQYWADRAVTTAVGKTRISGAMQDYAAEHIMAPILATVEIPVIPGEPPGSDQRLLELLCARDLARTFVTPDWRVQLSYRQLIQSRIWVRAIQDPAYDALKQHICKMEAAMRRLSMRYVTEELSPKWINPIVSAGAPLLAQAGSGWNLEVLQSVMLAATVTALMRHVVAPIEDAYNAHPAVQRVLPDRLASQGGARRNIKDAQAHAPGF